jgi:hypothetical protein
MVFSLSTMFSMRYAAPITRYSAREHYTMSEQPERNKPVLLVLFELIDACFKLAFWTPIFIMVVWFFIKYTLFTFGF